MKKLMLGFAAVALLVFAATAGAVAEKVFRLGVGDVVFVRGSKLSCSVANPYKQMVCFVHNRRGRAVPGTYGTTASNKFAGIVRFNSKGKPVFVTRKDNP
jgi:hypothetical protein